MKITETLYITNPKEWRLWLKEYYNTKEEIWLIFYKKHTQKPTIAYDDAVEEAICFGWIDSIVQYIDEEKYARKFTPRKDNNNWSLLNRKRAKKMIEAGKMTENGLKSLAGVDLTKVTSKKEYTLPPYIEKALKKNHRAWQNFNNLAPSYKRQYIGWITSAKREETVQQRLREAIEKLEKNQKLGMK